LLAIGEELRFVLITSGVKILSEKEFSGNAEHSAVIDIGTEILRIEIIPVAEVKKKCSRCWHRQADIGSSSEHPEICKRCIENVAGDGEKRQFA
jgi:isoleucyl-tRNA synthetase